MVQRFFCMVTRCWTLFLIFTFLVFTPHFVGASELSFSLTLNEQNVAVKTADGFSMVSVTARGYERLNEEGAPEIPYRLVNVLLPQGEMVASFRLTSNGFRVISRNFHSKMAGPQLSEDGVVGKGASLAGVSNEGTVFPAELGKYIGTGYLHGCAIASFIVFPLQIMEGNLVLNGEITLNITTEPEMGEINVVKRLRRREGFAEERRQMISSMVINVDELYRYTFNEVSVEKPRGGFQPTEAPSMEGSPVDYVIITLDSLAGAYQRLADWKTAKGVPTVVRTTEWIEANYKNGVDLQETIRFFLQDAYAKWGIKWALLGGDTPQLPPRYAYSSFYSGGKKMPADLYFACLDGSWNDNHNNLWGEGYLLEEKDNPDLYAEVYVGRLTALNVSEINTMIDKIINYESAYDMYFVDRMMLLAEVLFPYDWKPGDPISLNGADMAEFLYVTVLQDEPLEVIRMYETNDLFPGSVPENIAAALDSMESGLDHVVHIGHGFRFNMSVGDGSIIVPDALALYHPDQFFNLYMLNCTATAFDYNCLAEAYMRNPDGGAVSCVGSNESAFPNASSLYMNEYYRVLFDYDFVHVGETFARSRLQRTPVAASGDNVDLWTHYIYTLLADPEMVLWTGPVDTLDVFHVSNVGLGSSEILVNVTSGGLPVDSAFVCLSKGTDDYEYGATNALGNVTFDFTSESPGSISVVVTGMNYARHQGYIVVDASVDAYINLSDISIDDNQSGPSNGNGDGVIDAGETVEFTLDLKNTGGAASDSVWVVLRSDDSLVVIQDSIAAVGTIGVGNTKQALDPVRVLFQASAPDESPVEFTLGIYDMSAGEWDDSFVRLIHAPELELITLRIDDSAPLGNGSGRNDPGEEFKLFYQIKNYGTGAANDLTAELQDLDGAFIFFDSTDSYPDLSAMMAAENENGFHILETSTAIEHDLEVTITDGFSRVFTDTIELREPSPPSALEFDVSLGVDRIEVSWMKSDSSDVYKYQVYHSLTSGGPYNMRNVDPASHTVYLDTGLEGSTLYFYVVTALDSSGNESDYSDEFSASTNPPQLVGWPIEMRLETVCSPAVGDIDGDGDMEIVAGNNYVYAWHANSMEMIDGDGDPQTWGVLNTDGLEYVAPITLGNVDDVRGLDIIGVSYWTNEVFCFDYLGNRVAGWPQITENYARAAAIVCDLDGDRDPEIVAVDEGGVIYAWNRNGTEYRDGDNNPATQGVFYRTPSPGGSPHYQTPAACDIDDDGEDEIIIGTNVDTVYVLNEDGTDVPGWPVATNGDVRGSIAVGDIDDDGFLELVVPMSSAQVSAYNHDGTTLWTRWITHNVFFSPSPALADFNNDGKLETVIASSNKYLYVISHNGPNYPNWPIEYCSSTNTESSPVVADINGDGSLDIILGDESKYINAWDIDGNLLPGFPIATGDFVRATPAVADVDLDGDGEIVLAAWDKNLYVWDLDGYLDPQMDSWPTFHANIHRNGLYGAGVLTGIMKSAATLKLVNGAVEILWSLGSSDGCSYDILRGIVENESSSGFVRIASDLTADVEGQVRLVDRDVEMGRSYVYMLQRSNEPDQSFLSNPIYIPVSKGALLQNYPNPFNPSTRITFFVPEGKGQLVTLIIYDVTGARVKTLVNGVLKPGRYEEVWDGRNDGGNPTRSGVYFFQLRQNGFVDTKKMVLIK